ncbi:MAG: ABC transporter ATP-binding protein [Acidobacteriota bacterium]
MIPRIESEPVPALRLRQLERDYPFFHFGPVDLEVKAGITLGLLGVNGAGKSTLLRAILGLVRADSGTVEVLGLPMPGREHEAKKQVAWVSEDMAPYGSATIEWHLRFARGLSSSWDAEYARELLNRFGLHPGQKARGLSRGQTVRLLMVLALARRPRLLLLDEPTAGLDPRVRHEVRQELRDLARERYTTLIFSSHLTEDVEVMADEVVILHDGRIVRRAAIERLRAEGDLETVFLAAISPNAGARLPEAVCA